MVNALRIHPADSVAMALRDLSAGEVLSFAEHAPAQEVRTREPIPFGHKIALEALAAGCEVVKYGSPIGRVNTDVAPGQHVHVHNLVSVRGAAQ